MKNKIPVAEPEIGNEELQNVTEAIKSGWVSSRGPFIEEFENSFSKYIGTKHGISTSSGTTAIHLALAALGIGRGDKVLVPSLTFISVANGVTYTGAQPSFIDSNREYWCMDPSRIEGKIDDHTKAIILVHLYGHPCDMSRILGIAKDYNLHVIEDCAEAHGAEYEGKKVGSFGIVSCFSFYGNKIITTGEGGMCLTNDTGLEEKIRILRDHGMSPSKKYWHDIIGFNYRMTNIQAALGVAQLRKIDRLVSRKREIALTYKKLLLDMPEVTVAPEMAWAKSVFWLYSVLVSRQHRNEIIKYLERKGVESRPFFYPCHIMPPYECGLSLPIAEELSARGINLPTGFGLTVDDIHDVVELLSEAIERLNDSS
jgi:perosamine synthetase